ncbi:HD domain-containing protein [bacterium]|nr:HD domain-containing protein [bacterium]
MENGGVIRTREKLEEQERQVLAPYAVLSGTVGADGREHSEDPPQDRTHFQRDWHRITHSRAFRKLEYKTQVIVFGEGGEMGDVIRNRLTHTLEVSQIATSICRTLGLNEDLANAIALAHDLGHTPFGHSGEYKLRELVSSFNHNDHSLKIVRQLEHRYPGFDGLNLTKHTLAGIEKHDTPYDKTHSNYFYPDQGASLEAQVASIADQIAYRSHDVEDSITAGVLTLDDYHQAGLQLWNEVWSEMGEISDARVRLPQVTRRLINRMVTDVLAEIARRIAANGIQSVDDVYTARAVLADFSDALKPLNDALGAFLYEHFYFDYRVRRGTAKGQMIIERLFHHFAEHSKHDVNLLPPVEAADYAQASRQGLDRLGREPLRVIVDYIAGMTDREAYSLYVKLFEVGHG